MKHILSLTILFLIGCATDSQPSYTILVQCIDHNKWESPPNISFYRTQEECEDWASKFNSFKWSKTHFCHAICLIERPGIPIDSTTIFYP